jgi:hypothetical protein
MKARFNRRWALASRANLALALTLFTTGSALAAPGTPAQRRACTPDSLPSALRRHSEHPRHHCQPAAARASLGAAGRAVFEQ